MIDHLDNAYKNIGKAINAVGYQDRLEHLLNAQVDIEHAYEMHHLVTAYARNVGDSAERLNAYLRDKGGAKVIF